MLCKLEIKDLCVSVDEKIILNHLNLKIMQKEIHVLMGPNGAGKTTLANVIMGNPKCVVNKGKILFNGKDIINLKTDERAKLGLFLAFQHPVEIPGVNIFHFLKTAYTSLHQENIDIDKFEKELKNKLKDLKMSENFMDRYLNDGFSGGEKKRFEVLQMLILKPKIAIMDETDSGLDIDTLKTVAKNITLASSNTGILYITHYDRILKYIKPDFVHILIDGKIVESGGTEIVKYLEKYGYDYFRKRNSKK